MRFRARNAMAVALAATAIVTMTGTAAEAAPDNCQRGNYCVYDGSLYGGAVVGEDYYNPDGVWGGIFALQNRVRSIWNGQYADNCHNGAASDPDPWLYFGDWTATGTVGALFFTDGNRGWSSLDYYRDKLDASYNRCNTKPPSYSPHDD